MLQEVAVALRRDDAKVEAEAVVRDDRRLRRSLRRDVDDPRQRAEVVDERLRIGRGRDDVEVAHGLAHAPRGAGERDLDGRRVLAQRLDDRAQLRQRRPEQRRRGPCAACGLRERDGIFSSVPAPIPAWPRSCSASAAAFSPATVVIPSSFQIRRAVFGPRPGRRMKVATSAGTSAFRFVSAWISPSSTTSTILPSIVLPMSCSSFAFPSSASCATDDGVSRIRAAALR